MSGRARSFRRRATRATGLAAAFSWALLLLYLLSLVAPAFASLSARAVAAGSDLVELCTEHGVRLVVADNGAHQSAGQSRGQHPPGHHPWHDCPGCLVACSRLAAAGLAGTELPGPDSRPIHVTAAPPPNDAAEAPRPAARAPFPPRGPPIFL